MGTTSSATLSTSSSMMFDDIATTNQQHIDEASGVAQDVSLLLATSQTSNMENTSCFPVYVSKKNQKNTQNSSSSTSSSAAPMVVKLSHFLRLDKGSKNAASSPPLVANHNLHCIPPLGRPYTNGA